MDQVSFSATQFMAVASPRVTMVEPAGGTSLWVLGVLVILKALGNETGGSYSLLENVVAPGMSPPVHIHTQEDETSYILEGEVIWMVGNQEFHATKGCFIHLPRFVPHTFINKSDKPAHMLLSFAPAGFEKWFMDVGEPVADRNEPGEPLSPTLPQVEKAITFGKEYGVTFTGHAHKDSLAQTHASW